MPHDYNNVDDQEENDLEAFEELKMLEKNLQEANGSRGQTRFRRKGSTGQNLTVQRILDNPHRRRIGHQWVLPFSLVRRLEQIHLQQWHGKCT